MTRPRVSPVRWAARAARGRLRRSDRGFYVYAAGYAIVVAAVAVLAASLVSDIVVAVLPVSRSVIATTLVLVVVVAAGWFGDPAIRRMTAHKRDLAGRSPGRAGAHH